MSELEKPKEKREGGLSLLDQLSLQAHVENKNYYLPRWPCGSTHEMVLLQVGGWGVSLKGVLLCL